MTRIARAAGALRALGVRPGDRVSALALNSDAFLEHYMACWWMGAIPAPLNIRWTNEEAVRALRHVEASVLIVDQTFAPRTREILADAPSVSRVIGFHGAAGPDVADWEELISGADASVEDGGFGGDDTACLLFTGGTTGLPKAVELSHENLVVAGVGMRAMGCETTERLLHAPPLFHMGGIQMSVAHWLGGGTHVLIPGFDPAEVARSIQRHAVTDVLLAPTMIKMFLDQPNLDPGELESLRQVVYGTSPITSSLLDRAMEVIPNARFVQGYGMTETAMTIMLGPEHHTSRGRKSGKLSSIGLPSPLVEVKVVDLDGAECANGESGELVVRGASVMKGYWNAPEQTRQAIDDDGWMHTGDGARLDADGYVYLTDRIKDMIIITGGENVFSVEVENVLAQHPAVSAIAVVAVPHPVWVEAVHAVVVPVAGTAVTADELEAFARSRLAAYKVPRSIEFVDALPLSAAGKVLKAQVREAARARSDRLVELES